MTTNAAVVGRQPIVDRNRTLVGYELLFRPLPTSEAAIDPAAERQLTGDEMTNQVIFSALGLGIDRLTGGKTLFCNADHGVLTGQIPVSLPPKHTVIEVLETVPIDDEVLAGIRALGRAGYRIAADDFTWVSGAENLLQLVDIVKIDLRQTPLTKVPELLDRCREFDVRLLAEKIETAEELDACLDLDFELFQGYYLGRPNTISGPAAMSSRPAAIKLASAVLDDNVNYDRLETLLRTEPALSYQLIQLAAIGRFGEMKRDIAGVREALVWIGLERLRGWIPALLIRPAGRAIDTMLPAVLTRARLVEKLADGLASGDRDAAFTAGMISAFDMLLGVPRENVSTILDIPPTLQQAAFGDSTPLGRLISDVIDSECYGPSSIRSVRTTQEEIDAASAASFQWAMTATEAIDSAAA